MKQRVHGRSVSVCFCALQYGRTNWSCTCCSTRKSEGFSRSSRTAPLYRLDLGTLYAHWSAPTIRIQSLAGVIASTILRGSIQLYLGRTLGSPGWTTKTLSKAARP